MTKTGTSPCTPKTENTDLRSGLVNLSYQLNPNNRIDALWTRQTYWKPNRNAGAQIQPDSTWIEDDVFSIYQAHYSSQISSNALFDVRVSFSDVSFPLFLQPGVTQPNNVELTTGDQTGAASFAYAPPQHRTRLSLNGNFSYFKGHVAGADHSFKAGYEFYRGYSSLNLDALDGINLQTFNGEPSTVTEYNTEGKSVWEATLPGGVTSATRLSNGHTLVASSPSGSVIELDRSGKAVWEYKDEMKEGMGKGWRQMLDALKRELES